jgi:hypothetical protein
MAHQKIINPRKQAARPAAMGRVPKFVRADGGGSSMRFLSKRQVSTRDTPRVSPYRLVSVYTFREKFVSQNSFPSKFTQMLAIDGESFEIFDE